MKSLQALLEKYDRHHHIERIRAKTHHRTLPPEKFNVIFDPSWATNAKLPNRISSLLIDSYSQLPERPDLAFICLWMSFNAAYQQLAIRDAYTKNKTNITDEYGLTCVCEAVAKKFDLPLAVRGSYRSLLDYLTLIVSASPSKLFSMVATNAVQSIALGLQGCGGVYASKSFNGLKSKFPALVQAVEASYGKAYSNVASVWLELETRQLEFVISDPDRAQSIIRSLTEKLTGLIVFGEATFELHNTSSVAIVKLSNTERFEFFLRYVLYASRNNMAHGKVSSRLNSDTASAASYDANICIYVSCYIIFAVILVELGYGSKTLIHQAIKNTELIAKID